MNVYVVLKKMFCRGEGVLGMISLGDGYYVESVMVLYLWAGFARKA